MKITFENIGRRHFEKTVVVSKINDGNGTCRLEIDGTEIDLDADEAKGIVKAIQLILEDD